MINKWMNEEAKKSGQRCSVWLGEGRRKEVCGLGPDSSLEIRATMVAKVKPPLSSTSYVLHTGKDVENLSWSPCSHFKDKETE